MRLVLILAVCCAFVSATADAQQRRGDGGDRGDRARRGDTTIIHNYNRGYGQRRYYSDRRPGYRYDSGRGWYDPSAAIGGAIGGWLWRQWNQPQAEPPPQPVGGMAYCINRYKSYDANPSSPTYGTYLGYDMQRHPCP